MVQQLNLGKILANANFSLFWFSLKKWQPHYDVISIWCLMHISRKAELAIHCFN